MSMLLEISNSVFIINILSSVALKIKCEGNEGRCLFIVSQELAGELYNMNFN